MSAAVRRKVPLNSVWTSQGPSRGWSAIGKVAVVLAAVVATTAIRGLVLAILWGWFVQPLGVRSVNVAEAIGLATIIGFLTLREEEEDKKRLPFWQKFSSALVLSVSSSAMYLLVGWIAHLLVAA
jgi:hypothetical protein